MEVIWEVGAFAAKGLVVLLVIVVAASFVAGLARRRRRGEIVVDKLNDGFADMKHSVQLMTLERKELKANLKKERKEQKNRGRESRPKLYVIDFEGDLAASAVEGLRREVTALLESASEHDEVVVRLESVGGMVHAYGLAASQLQRIKDRGHRLTVCVDKVAASGGYMMACVAQRICAAPFAIIGSIGVMAPVPNVHRLLKKHGVDYEEFTAGEFKRTVSFLGEVSPEGRNKFQEQLEDTHTLFKAFVEAARPQVDINRVATGEYWFGQRALELSLVDELVTSDSLLLAKSKTHDIFTLRYHSPGWKPQMPIPLMRLLEQFRTAWATL